MGEISKAAWMEAYQRRLTDHFGLHPTPWDDEAAEEVWRSARGDLTPEKAADLAAEDLIAQSQIRTIQAKVGDDWIDVGATIETDLGWVWFEQKSDWYFTFEEAAQLALELLSADGKGEHPFRVLDSQGNVVPVPYSVQYFTTGPRLQRIVPCASLFEANGAFEQALMEHRRPGRVVLVWDERNNAQLRGCKISDDGELIDIPPRWPRNGH